MTTVLGAWCVVRVCPVVVPSAVCGSPLRVGVVEGFGGDGTTLAFEGFQGSQEDER